MSLQGAFLQIQNVDEKVSNIIHYNWKLNDELLIFCVKAGVNILPTNFTLYIWNRVNDPRCQFCNHCTESMAHLDAIEIITTKILKLLCRSTANYYNYPTQENPTLFVTTQ